ncbi:MAG TPA: hypothetical protein VM120_22215 [Bryobacteraceae bacterium]|nr:hypothetical protein [Bryobacteraceae bacterium]
MKNAALIVLTLLYWALHQDVWNWRRAEPFTFGFLPIGLTYHAIYTLGICLLMALLVKLAWPVELEREVEGSREGDRP